MALGAYPDVSLTSARNFLADARKNLVQDIDPLAKPKAKKQARQASDENSFASIARLWWDNWKDSRSPRLPHMRCVGGKRTLSRDRRATARPDRSPETGEDGKGHSSAGGAGYRQTRIAEIGAGVPVPGT